MTERWSSRELEVPLQMTDVYPLTQVSNDCASSKTDRRSCLGHTVLVTGTAALAQSGAHSPFTMWINISVLSSGLIYFDPVFVFLIFLTHEHYLPMYIGGSLMFFYQLPVLLVVGIEWVQVWWENIWEFLKKNLNKIHIWLAISPLSMCPLFIREVPFRVTGDQPIQNRSAQLFLYLPSQSVSLSHMCS